MFGQVAPTEYDLRFSIFGIPVRVHPMFWLIAAVMGWFPGHLDFVLIWVACLFVSILVHELGHALTAKAFGWPPDIFLYHMGGLARFVPTYGYTTSRSILISFMGPAAGFGLFGLVWIAEVLLLQSNALRGLPENAQRYVLFAIMQLRWINLWWGLVNLLPVLPLDGGQISRDICTSFRRINGHDLAVKIGVVVSGGVAAYFLMHREQFGLFPGILFGILCVQNFQSLQQQPRRSW